MNQQPQPIKQKLLTEIETLAEYRLFEVLNFVRFLQYQESQSPPTHNSAIQDNPLFTFIGGASHGTLAQRIDEDLYTP